MGRMVPARVKRKRTLGRISKMTITLFQKLKAKRQATEPEQPKPAADKRMDNPVFKKAVKDVLVYMGLRPTHTNFRLWDRQHGSTTPIAWIEFARNIRNPSRPARVYPIDSCNRRTAEDIPLDIPGGDVANLESGYEFKCWND